MLDAHAQNEKVYIAVVSADFDFRSACQRYSSLLYFRSLGRLTELLLSDDARVEKMRLAIEEKTQLIEEAIFVELQAIEFHHRNEMFEVHGYDSVDSEGVDVSIVAVGDGECTITFDTVQGMGFNMRWQDDAENGPRMFQTDVT